MMKVANKKIIRRLGFQSMKAGKLKNLVAVTAIALTTVLFTALFTILLSVKEGYEEQNFRQIGGYAHGGFKYLTEEQVQEMAADRDIKEYGLRRLVGMAVEEPFHKNQVEVSYCDANMARWTFLEPVEGSLPREGTNEAATDTTILSLLGAEPVPGAEFTMSFEVDGREVTETFVLSGYWECDEVSIANHVLIPESRAEEIFEKYGTAFTDGMTGAWNMDVMFNNSSRIEDKMLDILERHGYQAEDSHGDHYMPIGVNWGYISSELYNNIDFMLVLALAAALVLIVFTGYLIIYNVFRISVANDIRFYGMLKTIGATGRQLRRMIRQQAFCLSAAGLPLGLLLGWAVGCGLTGVVMKELTVGNRVSASVWIFIGAALFSLFTVLVSCRRPGKLAAAVSPIEAVRYTESDIRLKDQRFSNRKFVQRHKFAELGSHMVIRLKKKGSGGAGTKKGASLPKMAWANLGRSRSKTVITVLSLSLSLVLLTITVTLAMGFDMDKYLRDVQVDFLTADAGYFRPPFMWDPSAGVSEEYIAEIRRQDGVGRGGRTYGMGNICYQYVTEEYYRRKFDYWEEETLQYHVDTGDREQGLLQDDVQLYGMEPFILDHLEVLEGDISRLYGEGNYVAAVNHGGDSLERYTWAKLGDKVLIRYADELEHYNPDTGEVYPDYNAIRPGEGYRTHPLGGQLVEYEVAAVVNLPPEFSYRYYVSSQYILNADTFKEHSGTDSIMYYAFDMEEAERDTSAEEGEDYESPESRMESFLADYTEKVESRYDYDSKATYEASFESLRNMYIICGGVLSLIVGLVGALNFINVIVTSVLSRKRELAVLQSVGMTGRQLQSMLILEGLYYSLGAVAVALLLTVVSVPLASRVMNGIVWFFTYHFTAMPVIAAAPVFALLGVLVPLAVCAILARKPVVERLREAE